MSGWSELTERRRKALASLVRRKGREETGLFLVEGWRSVESAIVAGAPIEEVVVSESAMARPEVAGALKSAGVPIVRGKDADVERIGDVQTSQGVIGVARARVGHPDHIDPGVPVLVLDGVQDPGNVGTILRSAAWFGIRTVVAGPGTADWHAPKVVRASMGALWDLDLVPATDLAAVLEGWAGHREIWVADMEGTSLDAWRPSPTAVLVLGSEAHGPSDAVRRLPSGRVTIGRSGAEHGRARGTESLNVSAAAAVLMHAWTRSLE